MANNQTANSIIGRLILAATSYFIWLERYNRIFKKAKKNPEEIKDIIMVTVSLKLLTFKFKNTSKGATVAVIRWQTHNYGVVREKGRLPDKSLDEGLVPLISDPKCSRSVELRLSLGKSMVIGEVVDGNEVQTVAGKKVATDNV
ncbi:hypothetical protein Tco_0025531 [Tanacetum coccineum]